MKFLRVVVVLGIIACSPVFGQQVLLNDFAKIKAQGLHNQVLYGNKLYPLRSGLEEVYKPDKHHSNSKLSVTNGTFYSVQVITFGNLDLIWRARNAVAWFYVDMYSPGTRRFRGGEFSYVPNNTDENNIGLANTFFFKKGKFAIDLNGNGKLDKRRGEFLKVVGGKIRITQSGNIYRFDFTFTLENGVKAIGSYTGDFAQV